jgi:hypothetical protein
MHQVQIFSDHQNLEYFTTTKVLNRRQARWAQELAGIDFKIFNRPGSQNGNPDALSRRVEYRPQKGGIENQPISMILHQKHFASQADRNKNQETGRISTAGPGTIYITSGMSIGSITTKKWHEQFSSWVKKAGKVDSEYRKAWEELEAAHPREDEQRDRKVGKYEILRIKDGLLYRKGMLWIPEDKELIRTIRESEHNTNVAGHMGQDKTIKLVGRNFWWPRMDDCIIDFVRSCADCQINKAACHQPYGLLSPLELSYAPWQSIAMNFITDLPLSDRYDQLWVIVNRFTKMGHFLPLPKDYRLSDI